MVTYRAEELAQSGRMLTIFALYVSYTGDTALVLWLGLFISRGGQESVWSPSQESPDAALKRLLTLRVINRSMLNGLCKGSPCNKQV